MQASSTPGGLYVPGQRGVWERASFLMPASKTEEQAQSRAPQYMKQVGEHWEKLGYKVLKMEKPHRDALTQDVAPDQRRYVVWSYIQRAPHDVVYDIPDHAVAAMLATGMRLKD